MSTTMLRNSARPNASRLTNLRPPLGYVDGMNLYEYVGSSPVNHLDPLGLAELENGEWYDVKDVGTAPYLDDAALRSWIINGQWSESAPPENYSPPGGLKNFFKLPGFEKYAGWTIDQKTVKFTVTQFKLASIKLTASIHVTFKVTGGTAREKDGLPELLDIFSKQKFELRHVYVRGTASFVACGPNKERQQINDVPFRWMLGVHRIVNGVAVQAEIEKLKEIELKEAIRKFGEGRSSRCTRLMSTKTMPEQSVRYCRTCGYSLRGLVAERCPECGRPFSRSDARTTSRTPHVALRRWLRRACCAAAILVLCLFDCLPLAVLGMAIGATCD